MDFISDRLLRHLAWANSYVYDRVIEQPVEHLKLTAPNDNWSVGEILDHITADWYANLLDGAGFAAGKAPTDMADVMELKQISNSSVARLRQAAKESAGFVEFFNGEKTVRRNRETILAQAIHHATEHRAQIAGIFANHGMKVIDLDAIDLWRFADYEGLGD